MLKPILPSPMIPSSIEVFLPYFFVCFGNFKSVRSHDSSDAALSRLSHKREFINLGNRLRQ